ncbi:MAG: ORF6N domain-containing protein [Coriobacteriia bacterium]|nr:ORF6N domain-containing protein [Coriobacteriia bacterium]
MDSDVLSVGDVELLIHEVRGIRIILDEDIAALYEVETRQLVRAVQRNVARFPDDFMFRLSQDEFDELRTALGRTGQHGGRRKAPYAFTEHGVAMLSGVLRSDRAIQANVLVVRAFVRMRTVILAHRELVARIDELENRYDTQFSIVFDAIRQLMLPPAPARNTIGFTPPDD